MSEDVCYTAATDLAIAIGDHRAPGGRGLGDGEPMGAPASSALTRCPL